MQGQGGNLLNGKQKQANQLANHFIKKSAKAYSSYLLSAFFIFQGINFQKSRSKHP